MANNANKLHYHMACCLVMFRQKSENNDAPLESLFVNVVHHSEVDRNISADHIRKIHQGAQYQFWNIKMGVEAMQTHEVVDIVVVTLCYLGYMKSDVFLGKPVQQAAGYTGGIKPGMPSAAQIMAAVQAASEQEVDAPVEPVERMVVGADEVIPESLVPVVETPKAAPDQVLTLEAPIGMSAGVIGAPDNA